jgi:hypothetical protein
MVIGLYGNEGLTMRKFILMGMILLPGVVVGASDCRIVEYPENYEVVCVGDGKYVPVPVNAATKILQPVTTGQVATPLEESSATGTTDMPRQIDAELSVRVPGKRRLQTSSMDAARAMRTNNIQNQRQIEIDSRQSGNTQVREQ